MDTAGRLTKSTAGTAAKKKRSAASANGGTLSQRPADGHERESPDRDDDEDEQEVAEREA